MELRASNVPKKRSIDITKLCGKSVFLTDGREIAKVQNFLVDPKSMSLSGMFIKGGLFDKNHYVNVNYIHEINENNIILSINSFNDFEGIMVKNHEGDNIGIINFIGFEDDKFVIKFSDNENQFLTEENDIERLGEVCIVDNYKKIKGG